MARPAICVSCVSSAVSFSAANFGMPKSSSRTSPLAVTRMFDGLRSRWLPGHGQTALHRALERTTLACAAMSSLCTSQYCVIGRPSTYSIARYGKPSSLIPASYKRAMCGCSNRANMSRSRANLSARSRRSRFIIGSFSATSRVNAPSARSASHTSAIPPAPSSRFNRYGPTRAPTTSAGARDSFNSDASPGPRTRYPPFRCSFQQPRVSAEWGRVEAALSRVQRATLRVRQAPSSTLRQEAATGRSKWRMKHSTWTRCLLKSDA